jgi:aminoglycoside phosphotransferase (APT) family kinase protein
MPQAEEVAVSDVVRSGAGFSNVSIAFRLSWREAGESRSSNLLLRGEVRSNPVYPDSKLERQFRVMACLAGTDVPVPRVFWLEKDTAILGFPFYIMGKIEGQVPSEFPPYHSFGLCYDATPAQRAKMWWGTLEAIAKIHKLDWRTLGLSFLGEPADPGAALERELTYWSGYFEWARGERQPVLEAVREWLRKNRCTPERVTLSWGDARLPNTIFAADGSVAGVLDWDMAALGDPEWDLTFMITLDWLLSEGTFVPRLEGFPTREETIARYEELTGWKVKNFFYNEVFATYRAGVIILRVQKNLLKMGIELPGDDPLRDNMCTRRLADLLGLPPPGATSLRVEGGESVSGTVLLKLTGAGGGEWHFTATGGHLDCRAGGVEKPDATVTIDAAEWAAIERGESNPFNAWTAGKLTVSGDNVLYQELAERIARTWRETRSKEASEKG